MLCTIRQLQSAFLNNSMLNIEHFKTHFEFLLKNHKLKPSLVYVAMSGGMDSTCLAFLLLAIKQPFMILHLNFNLRGEESYRDETFVLNFSKKNQLPILIEHVDTANFSNQNKLGVQEAARTLRNNWFKDIITKDKDALILTAHHGNDAIETFLFNALRGSSIHGLKSITPYQKDFKILRPLLCYTKTQIEHFVQNKNLDYVIDSSNREDYYSRNKIRHNLVPLLSDMNPKAINNLTQTIQHLQQQHDILNHYFKIFWDKMFIIENSLIKVPILKWKNLRWFESYTLYFVQPFGLKAAQLPELVKLFDAANSAFIQTETHRFIKNRSFILIEALHENQCKTMNFIEVLPTIVKLPFGEFKADHYLKTYDTIDFKTGQEQYIDATHLELPLILRPWKQGDYFYPIGLNKKKKLSKYFKDLKLSLPEKEQVWVLTTSQNKIIWVLNYRLDERFKITLKTKKVVLLSIELYSKIK
ncbi:MAG: tRNA lysidine(34) synthetase TilS [Alphaproteobacteria bacterium]|nr:tRNA lysidine(34) synthetase TilS [Alphaproteobacteria bacterium]